jgi:hypothetical protein
MAMIPPSEHRQSGGCLLTGQGLAIHLTPAAFDPLHDIIGNGQRARRYARMNPPGSDAKYTTIHHALTDAQLEDHILGRATYVPIMIGKDGLASAGLANRTPAASTWRSKQLS